MDFHERLEKAISRGRNRQSARARAERARTMNEAELKTLHSKYRLQVSDHIEKCLRGLPNHFPGFQFELIFGEKGWGAAVRRDDVGVGASGRRGEFYSRLEITVRPMTSANVLELNGKGTIRDKEVFNRKHFERLQDADPETFIELVDHWAIEYAELFATSG